MIVYLNGQWVPEAEARISVFDRGFLYGDGLFETIPCYSGIPFAWEAHWQRLTQGATALRLPLPLDAAAAGALSRELLTRNQLTDALVRWNLSRGVGPRGYRPSPGSPPTLVAAAFPGAPLATTPPPARRLQTSRLRLAPNPGLTEFKSSDKLLHVLARAEIDAADIDEALLLDTDGHVAEASAANVFWWTPRGLATPALTTGILAGVTRAQVFGWAAARGWEVAELRAPRTTLLESSGAFLTSSTFGLAEIARVDGTLLGRDPRFAALFGDYLNAVRCEVSG